MLFRNRDDQLRFSFTLSGAFPWWVPPREVLRHPFTYVKWLRQRRYERLMAKLEAGIRDWARRQQLTKLRRTLSPYGRYAESLYMAQAISKVNETAVYPARPHVDPAHEETPT